MWLDLLCIFIREQKRISFPPLGSIPSAQYANKHMPVKTKWHFYFNLTCSEQHCTLQLTRRNKEEENSPACDDPQFAVMFEAIVVFTQELFDVFQTWLTVAANTLWETAGDETKEER